MWRTQLQKWTANAILLPNCCIRKAQSIYWRWDKLCPSLKKLLSKSSNSITFMPKPWEHVRWNMGLLLWFKVTNLKRLQSFFLFLIMTLFRFAPMLSIKWLHEMHSLSSLLIVNKKLLSIIKWKRNKKRLRKFKRRKLSKSKKYKV